jgi:hypothetical protein
MKACKGVQVYFYSLTSALVGVGVNGRPHARAALTPVQELLVANEPQSALNMCRVY